MGVEAKIRQRRPSATQLAKFLQFSKPVLADSTDNDRCSRLAGMISRGMDVTAEVDVKLQSPSLSEIWIGP
jgi:hypothetical protein